MTFCFPQQKQIIRLLLTAMLLGSTFCFSSATENFVNRSHNKTKTEVSVRERTTKLTTSFFRIVTDASEYPRLPYQSCLIENHFYLKEIVRLQLKLSANRFSPTFWTFQSLKIPQPNDEPARDLSSHSLA